MFCVRPITLFFKIDIGLPYLAHGCITIGWCVRYIHDHYLMLFVLWHSHIWFDKSMYHHGRMCCVHSWTLYNLDLWPKTKIIYFHHKFESGKMFLLFDIGISNFDIWVYHHETTCCVHSWQSMTLTIDLCVGGGVSLLSFTHSFHANPIILPLFC